MFHFRVMERIDKQSRNPLLTDKCSRRFHVLLEQNKRQKKLLQQITRKGGGVGDESRILSFPWDKFGGIAQAVHRALLHAVRESYSLFPRRKSLLRSTRIAAATRERNL